MDRIDLHIEVPAVPFEQLSSARKGETSAQIRERVVKTRNLQEERFKLIPKIHYNAQLEPKQIEKFCSIDEQGQLLLKMAMDKMGLSARSYSRILKVSRTIADMEG